MFGKYGLMFFLLGICLFGAGVYAFFNVAAGLSSEADRVEALPGDDSGLFVDLQPGREVAITGTLVDNTRATSPNAHVEQVIQQFDLVAYTVDEWHVRRVNSDGSVRYQGSWERQSQFIPEALGLDYGNETVYISAPNGTPVMENLRHSDVRQVPGSGLDSAHYDGESLRHGALRVRGYQNGDTLTVVGTTQSRTLIHVTDLYGGTRSAYIDHLRGEAEAQRLGGVAFMIIGVVFVLIGLMQAGVFNVFVWNGEGNLSPEELARRAR